MHLEWFSKAWCIWSGPQRLDALGVILKGLMHLEWSSKAWCTWSGSQRLDALGVVIKGLMHLEWFSKAWCTWSGHQSQDALGVVIKVKMHLEWSSVVWRKTGVIIEQRKNQDHPNYQIVKINRKIQKNPKDLWRLAIIPMKDHQLTLVQKAEIFSVLKNIFSCVFYLCWQWHETVSNSETSVLHMRGHRVSPHCHYSQIDFDPKW